MADWNLPLAKKPWTGMQYSMLYGGQPAPYADSGSQILDALNFPSYVAYQGQQQGPNAAGRYQFGNKGLLGGTPPPGTQAGGGILNPQTPQAPQTPQYPGGNNPGAVNTPASGGFGTPPGTGSMPSAGQFSPTDFNNVVNSPNAANQLGSFQGWNAAQLAQLANMTGGDPAAQAYLGNLGGAFQGALSSKLGSGPWAQEYNYYMSPAGQSQMNSSTVQALAKAMGVQNASGNYSPAGLLGGK